MQVIKSKLMSLDASSCPTNTQIPSECGTAETTKSLLEVLNVIKRLVVWVQSKRSVSCHLESTILLDYSVCDMIWHRGFGLVNQPVSNQRPKKKPPKKPKAHKVNRNSKHR